MSTTTTPTTTTTHDRGDRYGPIEGSQLREAKKGEGRGEEEEKEQGVRGEEGRKYNCVNDRYSHGMMNASCGMNYPEAICQHTRSSEPAWCPPAISRVIRGKLQQ